MGFTKILTEEHRIIEGVLDCVQEIARRAEATGRLDDKSATEALEIIRDFADKCHHGKEENHLFPALIGKGLPKEVGPVAQMLVEHQQGRQFVQGMTVAVKDASAGDAQAVRQFASHAYGYVQLLQAHIRKEDAVLFPMAERMFGEQEQDDLARAFDKVELELMGEGAHEKYVKRVALLAERLGIPMRRRNTGPWNEID